MSTAAPTIRSLDARVDDLEKEFRQFIAEMRSVVTLLKWIGGFRRCDVTVPDNPDVLDHLRGGTIAAKG